MLASSIPTKIAIQFAASAGASYVSTIPASTVVAGRASFTAGFPPLTFLPELAGGIFPDGRDVNGILQACTAWLQWQNAGGPVVYDAAFSTAIGGYPVGAMLSNAMTGGLFWISSADNNTTNPDSSGSVNWIGFPTAAIAVETARAQGVEATKAALAGSASQVFNVANAVTAAEAVALGQADARYALLAGSSGQVFNVANAVTSTEAVALGQFVVSAPTTSGYAMFPGGLIIQWATGVASNGGDGAAHQNQTIPWPVTFPTAAWNPFVSTTTPTVTTAGDAWWQVTSYNTSGVSVQLQNPGSNTAGTTYIPVVLGMGF